MKDLKGMVPEPKINVRSGSIKGSYCLPFTKIINKNNNTFKNIADLNQIFKEVIDIKIII